MASVASGTTAPAMQLDEIAVVLQLALVLSVAYLAWVVRDAAAQLTERLDGFGEALERIERRLGTAVVGVARSMDAIKHALENAERERGGRGATQGSHAGAKHGPRQAAPRGVQSASPVRGVDRESAPSHPPETSGQPAGIVERRRQRTSAKPSSELQGR